jgi:hypothetical protein
MHTISRFQLPLALLLCLSTQLIAQDIETDTFRIAHNGEVIEFTGVVANTPKDYERIALGRTSFPVVILPYETTQEAFFTVEKINQAIALLRQQQVLFVQRDSLQHMEMTALKNIMDVQQRHISMCEGVNQQLNRSILTLNTQLDETRQLAKDFRKGSVRRSLWGVLLGGGIGFGAGVLIGILVNR